MGDIIRIDAVTLTYNGSIANKVHALGPLTLSIKSGEFLCILGESGCGKSSLLRILAGLEHPTTGRVELHGEKIEKPSTKIGVVFQQPNLLPWLTAEENIALGFKIRNEKIPTERINEIIHKIGVKGFGNMRPSELSGGMAQRIAIGRALISNPEIILMDEPFAALDSFTRMKMQSDLIELWREEKKTILFITHDIDEAITLADRIVVLTPRPGKVANIFNNTIPHPRLKSSKDYIEIKLQLSEYLTHIINIQS